jgi:hypothetical protein
MNEDFSDEQNPILSVEEKAREGFEQVRDSACDCLTTATDYIRANPWLAVVGVAVVAGVLAATIKRGKPESGKFDAVREWLDEAYAKLPNQKQVQSMAESSGLPCLLKRIRESLHLN